MFFMGTVVEEMDWQVFVSDGDGFHRLDPKPSQAIVNHSPDGFSWGHMGSGPAQLALAILLHSTNDPALSADLYQDFKREFVGRWDKDKGWSIDQFEVLAWVEQNKGKVRGEGCE